MTNNDTSRWCAHRVVSKHTSSVTGGRRNVRPNERMADPKGEQRWMLYLKAAGGIPVGIAPNSQFASRTFQLETNDVVVIVHRWNHGGAKPRRRLLWATKTRRATAGFSTQGTATNNRRHTEQTHGIREWPPTTRRYDPGGDARARRRCTVVEWSGEPLSDTPPLWRRTAAFAPGHRSRPVRHQCSPRVGRIRRKLAKLNEPTHR